MTDPDEWRSVPPADSSANDPDHIPEIANPYADPGYPRHETAQPSYPQAAYAQPGFAQPGFAPPPGPELVIAPAQPALGTALRWAWSRLAAAPGTIIGAAALWGIIVVALLLMSSVIVGLVTLLGSGTDLTAAEELPLGPAIIALLLMAVVMSVIIALAMSCWLHGLIRIADGRKPELADFFRPVAFGTVLAVSLITSLVNAVADIVLSDVLRLGWASTFVSLAIGFCTLWMIYVATDGRAGTAGALRNGLDLSLRRAGPTAVVFAMTILLTLVGVLALVVGLLVTMPLVGLLTIYYYRSLTARPIAP
ncbi:hypothetical protein [Gordonia caeni]|uniref:DUF2189 domain-containing protein n=1 Tax=Gordonia caeni TaxID=1007097 RepID=A0ABP7P883_9ACTN